MIPRAGLAATIAIFFCTFLPACAAAQDTCSLDQIPANVRSRMTQRFPGWKIVSLQDLRADDQNIWRTSHPKECPGYATGHFSSAEQLSYAFNLFRDNGKQLFAVLLVIDAAGPDYKIHVLSKPQVVAFMSVVYSQPPGRLTDFAGTRQLTTSLSVIAYETLEAGQLVYFWSNGRYHSIQTSD
jgi:hypothetical protein